MNAKCLVSVCEKDNGNCILSFLRKNRNRKCLETVVSAFDEIVFVKRERPLWKYRGSLLNTNCVEMLSTLSSCVVKNKVTRSLMLLCSFKLSLVLLLSAMQDEGIGVPRDPSFDGF